MPRAPEETMRRLLDLMLAKDMDAVADLWAEDGTAEFPFAAGASPRRLVGREAVRGYLAGFPEVYDVREVSAITVHHTERPDTVVVEYHATGRSVRTGDPYRMDYIVVITVQDGLITRFRDYWNPLANATAAGALPELLDSLRSEAVR
ncbi:MULTISPECIES: nuclear transport factor 2 family protein [Streptomyces]|uniref:nuclear transport factor 2 family protein n=1 Tax=Streptomyces lycopersici TaxID=2974589 RepID=UPI0021D27958|nr:nuclear transport factor 2 family protein [Streptomyces sp. NEAU-383]